MEPKLTIHGQEFKVGQKVYIFRKETFYYTQDNSFQHTAVFKSEISEINKRTFKVKGLNRDWDRFQYEIVDNEVIPCVNGIKKESFSFWNNSSVYTLYSVNEENQRLYIQTKRENPISMKEQVDTFFKKYKLALTKRNTRNLLEERKNFYSGWLTGKFGVKMYDILKDELSKREHVPNKQERKILRRKASQGYSQK